MDHFKLKCPIIRKIKDKNNINDKTDEIIEKKVLYDQVSIPADQVEKDYLQICRKYEIDKAANNTTTNLSYDEEKLLKKITSKMPKYMPDTDENGIEDIENKLYKEKELEVYNGLATKNDFNIVDMISQFSEKLIKLIQANVVN